MSTKKTPIAELQRMSAQELRREILVKRAEVAKMRLGLEVQSEKNHALYRRERKEIARMTMVLGQLQKGMALKPVATPKVEEKPSQTAKKSVKGTGSRSKKS